MRTNEIAAAAAGKKRLNLELESFRLTLEEKKKKRFATMKFQFELFILFTVQSSRKQRLRDRSTRRNCLMKKKIEEARKRQK